MKCYFYCPSLDKWYEGFHQGQFTDDKQDDADRIALLVGAPVKPVILDDDLPDPRHAQRFADPPPPPEPPRPPTLEERLAEVEAKLKALEKV